ncbi:DUF5937 family protein [Planomonospora sp. ID82291]|uniref:DUF5937 family protein n=1 Tax=Planomonospora sp. ID82291 TaxID=2738136 RepID=UPI0018C419C8|nr:DUF5937 family protein [Planomonospora sp. ID82291]
MRRRRAAPADQAYAELVDAATGRGEEIGRRLLDDPDRARSEAAEALRRLWKAAVEPEWPSMRQALRAEMLDRAVQVNREGLRAVLPRLHHSAACEGDAITVEKTVDIDVGCPEGLILVPSLFITDRMQCTTSDHWTPAIYYPASGRYLWAPPPTPRSLDRLLGATRSRILAALTTPLQTTVVARLVGVTAPTASEHLAILRDVGLIDSSRAGRTAAHELTEAGRALLDAASPRPWPVRGCRGTVRCRAGRRSPCPRPRGAAQRRRLRRRGST